MEQADVKIIENNQKQVNVKKRPYVIRNTCYFCDDVIISRMDGRLRCCKCKSLGIDYTKEYIRGVGSMPKEHVDKLPNDSEIKIKYIQMKDNLNNARICRLFD